MRCTLHCIQVCITYIPAPSLILFCQLAASALIVWGLSAAGIVSTERLTWESAKKYSTVVIIFAGFLYCNFKALQVCDCNNFQTDGDATLICIESPEPLAPRHTTGLVMSS